MQTHEMACCWHRELYKIHLLRTLISICRVHATESTSTLETHQWDKVTYLLVLIIKMIIYNHQAIEKCQNNESVITRQHKEVHYCTTLATVSATSVHWEE